MSVPRRLAAVAALALVGCSSAPQQPSDGGADVADTGKPNACLGKPNYVFDATQTVPNGFGIDACGSYAEAETSTETDSARAAQFITPLAAAKLPKSKPYKFSWTKAMFPNAPTPDGGMGDPNKANGIGYVVYFVDANTSKELLRVHTINNDYTPDDPSWAKLVLAATAPNPPGIELKISAAFFLDNAVATGTIPVTVAQPRLVTIDPTM